MKFYAEMKAIAIHHLNESIRDHRRMSKAEIIATICTDVISVKQASTSDDVNGQRMTNDISTCLCPFYYILVKQLQLNWRTTDRQMKYTCYRRTNKSRPYMLLKILCIDE